MTKKIVFLFEVIIWIYYIINHLILGMDNSTILLILIFVFSALKLISYSNYKVEKKSKESCLPAIYGAIGIYIWMLQYIDSSNVYLGVSIAIIGIIVSIINYKIVSTETRDDIKNFDNNRVEKNISMTI
ncbi:MAG: hypothetical protein E7267_01440 [Lachnospiraceae bacterium]|nr:hypothetical protein [Lachnospiraceae bacterium]